MTRNNANNLKLILFPVLLSIISILLGFICFFLKRNIDTQDELIKSFNAMNASFQLYQYKVDEHQSDISDIKKRLTFIEAIKTDHTYKGPVRNF
jgi:hypothetical protein